MRRTAPALLLAGVVLATGCHGEQPRSWSVDATVSADPVHVFGPHARTTGNCDDVLTGIVRGGRSTYVEEATCLRSAGFETSRQSPVVIHLLTPDGSVRQLPPPPIGRIAEIEPRLVAADHDGSLIAFGADSQLLRYDDSAGWRALSAPHSATNLLTHSGDGGPVSKALVVRPTAGAVGADGALYVAEPFAVRRITSDGSITTVAGTDRLDPKPIAGMTVSHDGTLWVVSAGVVYRIAHGELSRFATLPSPSTDAAYSLVADPHGKAVFGYDGAASRIYRLDISTGHVTTVAKLPPASTSPGTWSVDLAALNDGTLLACDREWGLYRVTAGGG